MTGSSSGKKSYAWRPSGRFVGFPEEWVARADIPFDEPARVGVLVHVYYPELLDELLEESRNIPVPFDMIITNASGSPLAIDTRALEHVRNVVVLDVKSRGRDILPMVSVVNAGLLDPYDLVLKIHTKKSEWRADHALDGTGAEWRNSLLSSLLGSQANVEAILSSFRDHLSVGCVTSPGSALGREYWGGNRKATIQLARRLELSFEPDEIRFAAGSMYWIRGFVLQGLRALCLRAEEFDEEDGQIDGTLAHAIERFIGVVTTEAGYSTVERDKLREGPAEAWRAFEPIERSEPRVRFIPFYLPQFHPIPENDQWWGKGFTEWTNVSRAHRVYRGQHQPKIPLDTGFYDLRNSATVELQTRFADEAGIAGFMYYYYWFAGKKLLDQPIKDRLLGKLDLPFCLMWANENWTRSWNGRDEDVLMEQRYDEVPAESIMDDVIPIMKDPRYLRVGTRPVFAVYRPAQIPDLDRTVERWRAIAQERGVGDLFLLAVDVAVAFDGIEGGPTDHGFDGSLGFPPHNYAWRGMPPSIVQPEPGFKGTICSYAELVNDAEVRLLDTNSDPHFPGVAVGFDNTARRELSSNVWYGSNPYTFRRWLATAAKAVMTKPMNERLVFINAWNEWAEGAALEPSDRFARTYLLAVRDVATG